jgi:hypothetical protein
MATLQDIFNSVVLELETVAIPFDSKKDYENMRVSLLRKFRIYKQQCSDVGISSYDDRYLSASFDSVNGMGVFQLKDQAESGRVRKQYLITKL